MIEFDEITEKRYLQGQWIRRKMQGNSGSVDSQIMRYLKKLSLYEGGMEVALTVADELKKYYSRKSAMMDELRKVMG